MPDSKNTGQSAASEGSSDPQEGAWTGWRRYPRTNVESEFVTAQLDQDKNGFVIDISEGGMLVETTAHMDVKDVSYVSIGLPGKTGRFAATGVVAWVGPAGRTGIQFLNIPDSARALLKEWLSERPVKQLASSPLPASAAATESSAEALAAARRDAAMLALATQRAASFTNADGAALAVGTAAGMCCCAAIGNAPTIGTALNNNSGLSGVCLRTAELVQCDDTETDPRVNAAACRELNLRSLIVVPILFEGNLRGVLELFSSKPYGFDVRHRQHLEAVARSIAPLLSDISWEKLEQQFQLPAGEVSSSPTVEETPVSTAETGTADEGAVSPTEQSAWATSQIVCSDADSSLVTETDSASVAPAVEKRRRSPVAVVLVTIVVLLLALAAGAWFFLSHDRVMKIIRLGRISSIFRTSAAPSVPPQNSPAVKPADPDITVTQNGFALPEGSLRPAGQLSDVVPGKPVHMVQPVYPAAARSAGVLGTVVLTAIIDTNGFLENVKFVRGPDVLAPAAIEALQQWLYEPYRLKGKPVVVETTFVVSFASASH